MAHHQDVIDELARIGYPAPAAAEYDPITSRARVPSSIGTMVDDYSRMPPDRFPDPVGNVIPLFLSDSDERRDGLLPTSIASDVPSTEYGRLQQMDDAEMQRYARSKGDVTRRVSKSAYRMDSIVERSNEVQRRVKAAHDAIQESETMDELTSRFATLLIAWKESESVLRDMKSALSKLPSVSVFSPEYQPAEQRLRDDYDKLIAGIEENHRKLTVAYNVLTPKEKATIKAKVNERDLGPEHAMPRGWTITATEDGTVLYVNERTKEVQRSRPQRRVGFVHIIV